MNIIDLFCGTGGFSHGIQKASEDYTVVGGIDKNEDAVRTFNANHEADAIATDITSIDAAQLLDECDTSASDVNLVVGGPPCQGFSTLQPGDGDDERNYLYQDFLRHIESIAPEYVVMENVPEITKSPEIISDITQRLDDAGFTTEWRVLNAVFYGVPQTRKRFVLIACQNGEPMFPAPTHESSVERGRGNTPERYVRPTDDDANVYGTDAELQTAVTVMQALSDLPFLQVSCNCDCDDCRGHSHNEYAYDHLNEYQRQMRDDTTQLTQHKAPNHSNRMIQLIQNVPEGSGMRSIPEDVRPGTGFTSSYGRIDGETPCTTLTSAFTSISSNKCAHPRQNRALTIREGARIQSFSDDFVFSSSSKSEKARQIGNAVPPLLGEKIGIAVAKSADLTVQ